MMTSSNENIFRVSGPLCGEFTSDDRWIPHTRGQWRGALMFSLIWVNNGGASDLRRHRADYDVTVMCVKCATLHCLMRIGHWDSAIKLNTLRPRQNGRRFADDTFKRIFLNENVRISIKISLKFVPYGPMNNIPALVQIMAWRRSGDKPLSEPMMVSLLTRICVTRPQWVKWSWILARAAYDFDCMIHCTVVYVFTFNVCCSENKITTRIIDFQWNLILLHINVTPLNDFSTITVLLFNLILFGVTKMSLVF